MNEAEWLASADPKPMLEWRQGGNPLLSHCPQPPISDRKLRLWVEACRAELVRREGVLTVWRDLGKFPEELSECVQTWSGDRYTHGLPLADRADLFRCVVGNPWRPVTLCGSCVAGRKFDAPCADCGLIRCWNGGTVAALAREIYGGEEACGRCSGGSRGYGPPGGPYGCIDCGYTGKILGPFNAALMPILADALEDASCTDVEILNHLRRLRRCLTCRGDGKRDCMVDAGYNNPHMMVHGWEWCHNCNRLGEGTHPGWVRSDAPCVRGCHVIDLLLGLE